MSGSRMRRSDKNTLFNLLYPKDQKSISAPGQRLLVGPGGNFFTEDDVRRMTEKEIATNNDITCHCSPGPD